METFIRPTRPDYNDTVLQSLRKDEPNLEK
jgi:hypothetical protein